jgi:hypothetical protein
MLVEVIKARGVFVREAADGCCVDLAIVTEVGVS